MEPKYACYKTSKVEDRCIKTTLPIDTNIRSYSTLDECMKNCNLEDEEIALNKLKEKYKLKNLIEYIRPDLKDIFSNFNDIPILNYTDTTYNKNIFNSEEMELLYNSIQGDENELYGNEHSFIKTIFKSCNAIISKEIIFKIKKSESLKIVYSYDDMEEQEDYTSNIDDEYIKNFNEEIKNFIDSSNIFLIKDVVIDDKIFYSAHATFLMIKKNGRKLDVFTYNPASNSYSKISKLLEIFIKNQFSTKYEYSFLNLSTIYGLQDFEIRESGLNNYNIIKFHEDSILEILDKFSRKFYEIYYDFNDLDSFRKEILKQFFYNLPDKYILKDLINKMIDDFYKDYNKNGFISEEIISNFKETMKSMLKKLKDDLIKFKSEKDKLALEKNEEYVLLKNNYYFGDGYCFMWCKYTLLLMLINPNEKPSNIIKISFYQSTNKLKMERIYNLMKENISIFKKKSEFNIFESDYFDKIKINDKVNNLDPIIQEHTRLLFIKITNFIIIDRFYNRIDDDLSLVSIDPLEEKLKEKIYLKLKNFKFPSTEMTKENIIRIVKNGKNIIDVNSLILQEKKPSPFIINNYFAKYLKYKQKYLLLKNYK